MKEGNDFENTINDINRLTEEDAKALWRIIYGFVSNAVTGNGGDEEKLRMTDKLIDIYKRIPVLTD